MNRFFGLKLYILLFILVGTAVTGYTQLKVDPELSRRLEGKDKFADIQTTVHNYLDERHQLLSPGDTQARKDLRRMGKMWNRVLFDAESHLDANGRVVNASRKNFEYLSSLGQLNRSSENEAIENSYGSWSFAGPTSVTEGIGRINRIAFDPSNSAVIYAGSAGGGLYKTTNGGITWTNISSFLASLGISGIVVTNSNTIYILTGDGDAQSSQGFTFSFGYIRYSVGVLKSTDGGSTWQSTGAFPGLNSDDRYSGMKLVRDPNDPNTLLAATTAGLFRTTDGGNSWTQSTLSTSSANVMVYDVEFAPGRSDIVYCGINFNGNFGAFLRSTTSGMSFNTQGSINYSPDLFNNIERLSIAVTPANPNAVFILAGPGVPSGNVSKGVWYSNDLGLNFSRRSNTPNVLGRSEDNTYSDQNLYDMALAVSPTNETRVVAAGLVIYRSIDGGFLFVQATPYHGSSSIHPDVHELVYNEANGNLYAGTDGGVAVSSDNGANWSKLFTGLTCTQFYHFGLQDDEGNLWGGTQDNGILVKNGSGSSFDRYSGGDGYDVLTDMAPAGNQDDIYYVVNTNVFADAVIDEDITPPQVNINASSSFFPNLGMSPANEDVIYAGYPTLYISYNRGSDWYSFGSPAVPGNWSLSNCPTNRKRLYTAGRRSGASGTSGLFRVDNLEDVIPIQTTNLTAALHTAGYPAANPKITDIAVSSNSSSRLWITVGGYDSAKKVYYSNNAGANWVNISGSLPNLPANCIVADDNDNMYVGTDIGVYYRGSGDADWTPFYNGLPRVAVSELEILNVIGGLNFIYASTFGRGIWSSEVFSPCTPTLTISSSQIGQKFYQAGTINSTSSVNGGAGTDVRFRAGTEVILDPGFTVNPGAEFTGFIGPCNSGIPLRNAGGDSILLFNKNIASARQYGMVHEASINGQNIVASFNIFSGGNYTIRVFDVLEGIYVDSLERVMSPGKQTANINMSSWQEKLLRIDLFSGNLLVHTQDVLTK